MRLGFRITLSALLATGLSGPLAACTIMDELDSANKAMKVGEPSPGAKPPDAAEPGNSVAGKPQPKKPEPGLIDKMLAWTKKSTEPAPKPHDPNDPIVKCQTHGSMTFVYKFDCQQSGGVVVGSPKA
jgi:hypothetical protein